MTSADDDRQEDSHDAVPLTIGSTISASLSLALLIAVSALTGARGGLDIPAQENPVSDQDQLDQKTKEP